MSSSSTYSTYIGRVGMLAVALGIGSAIAAPPVAWADQGAPSDATSASPHSTTGPPGTDSAAGAADHQKPEPDLDDGGRPADDAEPLTAAPDEPADQDTPEPTPTGLRKVDLGSPTARTPRTANGIALTITRAGRPESREAAETPLLARRPIVITPAAEPTAVQTSAVSVTPTPSPAASGFRGVVLNVLGAYRRVESTSAGTAPGHHVDDSPAPAAAASATMAATALPSVTAAITNRSPAATRPSSLIRTVVLGVLGIFGFNPNRTNNPVLQGIWNTYRKAESYISNIPPDIAAVHVLGTSIADDGRVAVRLGFDVTDYDGDPFTVFESGIPDFEQNPDGTFTYFADTGFSGTGRAWVTAVDSGDHFHNFALWDYSGGHYRTAAITLTFTAAQPAAV